MLGRTMVNASQEAISSDARACIRVAWEYSYIGSSKQTSEHKKRKKRYHPSPVIDG